MLPRSSSREDLEFLGTNFSSVVSFSRGSQKTGKRAPTPYSKYPSVSCRPSTKKGGIYLGKPAFPKNTLKKAGIWSRG